jgi:hypothetical protein
VWRDQRDNNTRLCSANACLALTGKASTLPLAISVWEAGMLSRLLYCL